MSEVPEAAVEEERTTGRTARMAKNLAIIVVALSTIGGVVVGAMTHFATAADVEKQQLILQQRVDKAEKATAYRLDMLLKSQYEEKYDDFASVPPNRLTQQQRGAMARLQRKITEIEDRWKGFQP